MTLPPLPKTIWFAVQADRLDYDPNPFRTKRSAIAVAKTRSAASGRRWITIPYDRRPK